MEPYIPNFPFVQLFAFSDCILIESHTSFKRFKSKKTSIEYILFQEHGKDGPSCFCSLNFSLIDTLTFFRNEIPLLPIHELKPLFNAISQTSYLPFSFTSFLTLKDITSISLQFVSKGYDTLLRNKSVSPHYFFNNNRAYPLLSDHKKLIGKGILNSSGIHSGSTPSGAYAAFCSTSKAHSVVLSVETDLFALENCPFSDYGVLFVPFHASEFLPKFIDKLHKMEQGSLIFFYHAHHSHPGLTFFLYVLSYYSKFSFSGFSTPNHLEIRFSFSKADSELSKIMIYQKIDQIKDTLKSIVFFDDTLSEPEDSDFFSSYDIRPAQLDDFLGFTFDSYSTEHKHFFKLVLKRPEIDHLVFLNAFSKVFNYAPIEINLFLGGGVPEQSFK